MSLWSRKPFIAVRVLGRTGQYPQFEIRSPSHMYSASERLVWTAVLQPALSREWELGEVTVLVPEEVRVLSAVALSESRLWEKGLPIITHLADAQVDPSTLGFDLTVPATFRAVEELAHSLIGRNSFIDNPYVTRVDLGSREDAVDLLTNIDAGDQLLLAGLARLLGAGRILQMNEPEEAAISLFVSMGAALEYVRLHLEDESGREAAFAAVYDYFRRTFPHGDEVVEYFEARYDERVIATHPANRFGEFWAPPLMADDVYHLQKTLIGLYRHILLGETDGW
jgi:hypothetical protein